MLKKFTFWFTAVAALVCFFNAIGYDRDNMLLMSVSIPGWFMEMFLDIHYIHRHIVYASTILFWLLAGYFLDRTLERRGDTRSSSKSDK
ncbi:hypothetical protein [Caldalkalibacillus salinus]|uniref:hypothetical protein n=1 Tax=Caldalkalibacillus salinus TaxID=2803787 RepID=UPI0019213D8D|nr:hypothetical protein [Caldalkalibacillus salinus]